MFVMPQYLLKCHPFVASSYFNPSGADIMESEDGDFSCDNEPNSADSSCEAIDLIRGSFIVDDDSSLGQAVYYARHRSKAGVTAVAVREHGTDKFCNELRFLYSLPTGILENLDSWIFVPKHGDFSNLLFFRKEALPRFTWKGRA
jgi:hypothetical protein